MENLIQLGRRLIKSPVGKYSAVNSVTKLIPFIVSVVLASLMAPSQYGTVSLVIVASSVVGSLTNYGFGVMVARESHLCSRQEFGELMSSSWIVSIIMLTLVLSCVVFFEQSLSWIGLEQELLVCGVVLGFLLGRVDLVSKYLVAQQKVRDFSVLELYKAGATALISVVLVCAFLEHAISARVTGLLIGAAIALVLAYRIVRQRVFYHRPRINLIHSIFSYGTKTLPQAVANWMKIGADKVVIGSLVGLDMLGAYSFTFLVCSLFMVFGSALNNAYIGPCILMYKAGDLEGVTNLRVRYVASATALMVICFLSVIFMPLVYWPDGYKTSVIVMGLLMLSFWAQVVYLLYNKYFFFSLKIVELGFINVLAAITYVAFLVFFGGVTLEFVALCFCVYNLVLAFYVVLRTSYLEKELSMIDC